MFIGTIILNSDLTIYWIFVNIPQACSLAKIFYAHCVNIIPNVIVKLTTVCICNENTIALIKSGNKPW